ncbi:hypothetical protein N7539_008631 [Penicillium diatomitis]|uniref:PARP-type domain-containing protein n=1 Tax=Penicillium diatomitis TaxID=2819901 RepID=A0A9W9WQY7_9EURO|nr:uncharacterized protein N7539_008631 [Penicillium diatomitis]KAJ5472062.1 hypothetical protein N7539_008631 [Penicillium diatomitis]
MARYNVDIQCRDARLMHRHARGRATLNRVTITRVVFATISIGTRLPVLTLLVLLAEVSPDSAGCHNKECRDHNIEITKGEIRVGTWVEKFKSWRWRHWGCTTPLVLANMIKNLFGKEELKGDEDFDRIVGWKGLSKTQQDAVRKALTERHIPDEDWKGDVECNRPGKRGFRLSKKKARAKKDADEYSQSSEAEAGERTKMTALAKKATDENDNIGKSRKLKPHTRGGKPEKKPVVDDSANEDANRYVRVEGRFFITTICPYCGCSSQERKPFDTAQTHTKDA